MYIIITAAFNEQGLIEEGYDCGYSVKETWGYTDYEYSSNVKNESLPLLYTSFGIEIGNRSDLLVRLKELFKTNTAFSDFCGYLNIHSISFTGFSRT